MNIGIDVLPHLKKLKMSSNTYGANGTKFLEPLKNGEI